jgi:charged multivesicular body protein 6
VASRARSQLEADVARETAAAKALAAAGRRERALLALRCRGAKQKLLAQLEAYSLHVETLLLELDSAARSSEVLAALKEGTAALRAAAAATPASAVEALLGEHEEAVAAQQELAQALGAPATAGGADLADEDALLQELGHLTGVPQAAAVAEQPSEPAAEEEMPSVPTTKPRIAAQPAATPAAPEQRQAVLA